MFLVVLSTIFLGFAPLTAIMIVIMSLLDDVPIMTIAYDNTPVSEKPIRWQMPRLLGVAAVLGLFSIVESFGLLLSGIRVVTHPHLQEYFGLGDAHQLQTVMFLQLAVGGYLLLFVTRTERWFLLPPFLATPLLGGIVLTQIVAVLMCGLGWLVPAIDWSLIGWVWSTTSRGCSCLVAFGCSRSACHLSHRSPGDQRAVGEPVITTPPRRT